MKRTTIETWSAATRWLRLPMLFAAFVLISACDPGANKRAADNLAAAETQLKTEQVRRDRAIQERQKAQALAAAAESKALAAATWKGISKDWGGRVTWLALFGAVVTSVLVIARILSRHAIERSRQASAFTLEVTQLAGRLLEADKLTLQEYQQAIAQVLAHERDVGSLSFTKMKLLGRQTS